MASYQKFNAFTEYIAEGVCTLNADDKYVMLCNTAPLATNSVYSNLTEIANGNGYTTGGGQATVSSSAQTSGTYKLVLADPATWTATGGSIGPFRYAVLYQNSGTKPLIGFWDYGTSITLAVGEQFTADFDPTTGVIQFV